MRSALAFLCLLILASAPHATGGGMTEKCGTIITQRQLSLEKERIKTGWIHKIPERTRDVYFIPVTIHILRSSNGQGGFDPADIDPALVDLNLCFINAVMVFYTKEPVDFIDDNDFFGDLTTPDRYDLLRQVNAVSNTINIYIAPLQSGFPHSGLSSFTTDPVQGIIIREDCLGTPENTSTLAHEMGHYFDLYHTHATYFGAECPERVGCDTLGDLLCDTPADPNLNSTGSYNVSEYPECIYDDYMTIPDLPHCDQMTPYDPATDNIMSYSRPLCRTTLTTDQADRALSVLLTAENRRNLVTFLVPSMRTYGLFVLAIIIGVTSIWLIRRRRRSAKLPL